jgi:glyoxylase-like metal-dependent hydrolase (beta-lactamase superfamily II)
MPRLAGPLVVAFLFLGAGCVRGAPATPSIEPARQVLDAAVAAVGGRDAVLAVRSLVLEGAGQGFIVGQGQNPDDGTLPYRITELRRAVDFAHGRWRQSQTLTPEWAAQSREPSKETTAVDGAIGFDIGDDGSVTRSSDAVGRDRRTELRQSLLGILQLALAPGARVANLRRVAGREVLDVRAPDGQVLALTIDATTRLPASVASITSEDTLGDATVETEFAGYQRTDGLMLPTRLTSKLEHQVVAAIQVSSTVNAAVGDLAAPAQVTAAPAASATPTVTTEELAPGVWRLAGGSHHSVVVEQADHLVLIEAPWDDARTLAVLGVARGLRPGKPVTQVVCTHHHWDHASGIRAAVSEGLTIIAHQRNRAFLERLVARPRTIAPDALASRPRALKLETVTGQRTLEDPVHPVQLHVADTPHADTMLIVALPRERLLIEPDLYTPESPDSPPLAHPYAGSLLRIVEANHLQVDRVVPLHGEVVPFSALVEAARRPPPPPPRR